MPQFPVGTLAIPLPPIRRGRGVATPEDLHVAVRTNKTGVVVHAAGPFLDEKDAKTYVANTFDGQGYAVPFELVFRSPRNAPEAT